MIKLLNLLELGINKPNQISFIPYEKIYTWKYKGGSLDIDKYINPGHKIYGVLVFKKFIYLMMPPSEDGKYSVFNSKYFDFVKLHDSWNKTNADLSDYPITMNNINIIG